MQRTLRMIDWTAEDAALRRTMARQLRRRGVQVCEIDDRVQEAVIALWQRAQNRPDEPVAVAIVYAAADARRTAGFAATVEHHDCAGWRIASADYAEAMDGRARAAVLSERWERAVRLDALREAGLC